MAFNRDSISISGTPKCTASVSSDLSAAARVLVHAHRLRDLVAHGEERIERGHRVLQDHSDALAADVAHLGLAR